MKNLSIWTRVVSKMKAVQQHLVIVAILFSVSVRAVAQDTAVLPEVKVTATSYKYLRSVDNKELPQPVRLLEHKAATYDVKNSEFYDDEYDTYSIEFYLPSGYILATYDQNGKLIRTAERFRNVALPSAVKSAVGERFPNWSIPKDVYVVNYTDGADTRKIYKLELRNGDKRIRVKAKEDGTIMD